MVAKEVFERLMKVMRGERVEEMPAASALNGKAAAEKDRLFALLSAAYVVSVVGMLDSTKIQGLHRLAADYSEGEATWYELVEGEYRVKGDFVRAVFDLCVGKTGGGKSCMFAFKFILYGIGCPEAEDRLPEVLAGRPGPVAKSAGAEEDITF